MHNSLKIAAAIATALSLSTTASFAGAIIKVISDPTPIEFPDFNPVPVPPTPLDDINDAVLAGKGKAAGGYQIALACDADGADIVLINAGDAIPAGTRATWSANGERGTIALPNGLAAGQKARIADALEIAFEGACVAQAIS